MYNFNKKVLREIRNCLLGLFYIIQFIKILKEFLILK